MITVITAAPPPDYMSPKVYLSSWSTSTKVAFVTRLVIRIVLSDDRNPASRAAYHGAKATRLRKVACQLPVLEAIRATLVVALNLHVFNMRIAYHVSWFITLVLNADVEGNTRARTNRLDGYLPTSTQTSTVALSSSQLRTMERMIAWSTRKQAIHTRRNTTYLPMGTFLLVFDLAVARLHQLPAPPAARNEGIGRPALPCRDSEVPRLFLLRAHDRWTQMMCWSNESSRRKQARLRGGVAYCVPL